MLRGPEDDDGAERSLTFKQLAGQLAGSGGMIQARADVNPTTVGPAFAGHIVDVEVDPETGKVDILRYTAVQDVGRAIHPSYVEGQLQGGALQGIGMALSEEYFYDEDGVMRNSSLLDYRMPTALDTPMIDAVLVEVPNPGHPYGVRGVGEVPIVPPLAAITNAIHDAGGRTDAEAPGLAARGPGRVARRGDITAMATVFIPSLMRKMTDDRETVEVAGATLRQVVDNLDAEYPGIKAVDRRGRARCGPGCSLRWTACSPPRGSWARCPRAPRCISCRPSEAAGRQGRARAMRLRTGRASGRAVGCPTVTMFLAPMRGGRPLDGQRHEGLARGCWWSILVHALAPLPVGAGSRL